VGRALAERNSAQFIDLTGEPSRRADAVSGLRRSEEPGSDHKLRRVIAADRLVSDPAVRARLYRRRRVIWLDVPEDRLLERLRSAPRRDLGIDGDLKTFVVDHLAAFTPYYYAGSRIDASGSISATIAAIEPVLAAPAESGTLILRADIHGGLLELGDGTLGRSLRHVLQRLSARRCAVLTTPRSRAMAEVAVSRIRAEEGLRVDVVDLPDGERAKQLSEQEALFRTLANLRLERGDPLIAVGDDVLLEAATFAAAVYLRGIPLVTIPVTTLGMIDTSIGGKGGVDLPGVGRNLLGAIHQPTATILDVDLVRAELPADRRAALAEALKYGLLGDDTLLSLLESGARTEDDRLWPRTTELLELVERCAIAKRRLVLFDERDTGGVRMALNLGHTLSHALEVATGYRLRHGEAVAYGLRAALAIGLSVGVTRPHVVSRADRLLRGLGLAQTALDVPIGEVLGFMEADKKRSGGKLQWVLVADDGVTIRDDIPASTVRDAVTMALAAKPA
jgi:3-dehydroquinate synthetase